jgi:hypothetical protein
MISLIHAQQTKNLIVDQFGYLPNAQKFGFIADPQQGQNAPHPISPGLSFTATSEDLTLSHFSPVHDIRLRHYF